MWEDRHADTIERAVVRGSRADGYATFGATLTMLATVALTTAGALAIVNHELTVGALIAANMLSSRLLGPLNQLVATWRVYAVFKQSVERLGKLFASESERQASAIELNRPKGHLTLEHITFAYGKERKPVIDSVTLTIASSGLHAIIGRNGSGKSTLLKLIQGLYRPLKGRVLLDGADIGQFTRSELAAWIGYVPQECVLFAGTLRENVSHRKPDATDDEVIRAATAAGAHPFIIDLPDGYASDIGEAGLKLSAGQRQRIAIARALIGDPPVLLLDEPSSNLDRQAEHDLKRVLMDIGRERTIILVTHSPILLSACKDLIALDHGRVALAGLADEILPRLFGSASRGSEPSAAAPPTQAEIPAAADMTKPQREAWA